MKESNIFNSTGYTLQQPSIIKANGMKIENELGNTFLDFESGVWSLPLGHNPIEIREAMNHQLDQVSHVGYRYSHIVVEELAKALLDITHFNNGKCVFLSSGSEAVEYAMQIAKKRHPNKKGCRIRSSYLSAYGSASYQDPNWIDLEEDIEKLNQIDFSEIGYFMFEPGNYAGLVKLHNKEFVLKVCEKVKEKAGLILVDEVTTGMGRCGNWFGYMLYSIQPDIISCGKGLGNGYPVSAIIINEETMNLESTKSFKYAQSHQNDPLGCAVACAVISSIKEKNLLAYANEMGNYLRTQLILLQSRFSIITNIRGVGLMNAFSFHESIPYQTVLQIQEELYLKGLLVQTKQMNNTVRLYPPLIITKDEIDLLVNHLHTILSTLFH